MYLLEYCKPGYRGVQGTLEYLRAIKLEIKIFWVEILGFTKAGDTYERFTG